MTEISTFSDNPIGKEDRARLEAFGKHSVAHGRATRWCWARHDDGHAECFELFSFNDHRELAVWVQRDRLADRFRAYDGLSRELVNGELDHVLAALDRYLIDSTGELPDAPA